MTPERVRIREVGPRDGFQNEPEVVPTDAKVTLIDELARTGLKRLEATSFVRPDVIPQLADAAEVLSRIDVPSEVAVTVLIPNERGLENALEAVERLGDRAVDVLAVVGLRGGEEDADLVEAITNRERVVEPALVRDQDRERDVAGHRYPFEHLRPVG